MKTRAKWLVGCVVAMGVCGLMAEDWYTLSDGVLSFDVEAGGTNEYSDVIGSGVSRIVKTGAGGVLLSSISADRSFAGTLGISNGTVIVTSTNLALSAMSRIDIEDGGAFVAKWNVVNQSKDYLSAAAVHVRGVGPDGQGALAVETTGANGDRIFSNSIDLTGDATFRMGSRFGVKGALNLHNHRLTTIGNVHLLTCNPITIDAGGDDAGIDHNGSDLIFYNGTKFTGGATNRFAIKKANAAISFWAATINSPWTLAADQNCIIQAGDGAFATNLTSKLNCWPGAVALAADKKLTLSTYAYSGASAKIVTGVSGVVSGEGGLYVRSGQNNQAEINALLQSANTFTGGTEVASSYLWGVVDGSIPGPLLASGSGKVNLVTGTADGWTFDHIHALLQKTKETDSGLVRIWTGSGVSSTDTADIDFASSSTYRHAGPGTLTFSGALSGAGTLANHEGSLIFDGTPSPLGLTSLVSAGGTFTVTGGMPGETRYYTSISAQGGTMVLDDAADLYMAETDGAGTLTKSNTTVTVGGANTITNARLVLRGNTVLGACELPGGKSPNCSLTVNDTGTKGAILEVRDNAALTNRIHIGTSGIGAAYQYGGRVRSTAKGTNDGYIGQSGYGYYGLFDGNFSVESWCGIGANKDSEGEFEQRGGTFTLTGNPLPISRGGNGEYHMTGGVFTHTGTGSPAITLGNLSWGSAANGPMEAVLTLAGNSPLMTLKGWLGLAERTNTAVTVVNLNAGTLEASYMTKMPTLTVNQNLVFTRTNVFSYVNFGGGTFRAREACNNLFGSGVNKADAVTLFAGGATIDLNGKSVSNGEVPLTRPVGRGIASIALPADARKDNYVGVPKVYISGGGGAGAVAHCTFDAARGAIDGIEVVSPGWGFTETPTVTIKSGDRKTKVACTVTLTDGEPVSGGLTVTNSSATEATFTLAGTNTYAGATVVAGGTLKLANPGAISASRSLAVAAGATLDLNNQGDLTLDSLTGVYGSVVNGNLVVTNELVFSAADLAAGRKSTVGGTLTLAPDVRVRVTDVPSTFAQKGYTLLEANGLVGADAPVLMGFEEMEHPQLWIVSKVGNALKLSYSVGTLFILR